MAQRIWMFAPCKHHKCKCEDVARPCHFQSPKAWSKVMMGIWPPTAASYRNCDPPNFPCPGCAEKILKLCRTYQDVQVWGSSHMVWSTGLGPTDNDASPSNSLTVFLYIYIYILYYYMYIVSKHWRQMPTNYLVVSTEVPQGKSFQPWLELSKRSLWPSKNKSFWPIEGQSMIAKSQVIPAQKVMRHYQVLYEYTCWTQARVMSQTKEEHWYDLCKPAFKY